MGASNLSLYSSQTIQTSKCFKAFGHPARTEIISFLSRVSAASVQEIATYVGLSKETINQHLRELKEINLVEYKNSRNYAFYFINSEKYYEVKLTLYKYLNGVQLSKAC